MILSVKVFIETSSTYATLRGGGGFAPKGDCVEVGGVDWNCSF